MSIYERNGKWYVDIQVNGVRIHRKAGNTQEQALLTQVMLRKERDTGFKSRRILFDRATQEYLSHIKDTLSQRTHEMDLTDYNKHLKAFFADTFITEIDNGLLLKFQARQKSTRFKSRRLGNRTVNIHIGLIRKIMKFAEQKGYIDNPRLKYPMLREPQRLHAFLTPDEFKAIISHMADDLTLKRIKLGRCTGLRPKELAYLAWDDIDLKAMMLRVHSKPDAGFITKTDEERDIPLNKEAVRLLQGLPRKGRWVFSNGRRPILDIRKALQTAARKAGIRKRVTQGMLRHTFATHLIRKGVDIITVRQLMGHKSIETTQKYLHGLKDSLREAVERL